MYGRWSVNVDQNLEAVLELTGITVVCVCVELALGELEVLLRNDLVESVNSARENFRGVTVA